MKKIVMMKNMIEIGRSHKRIKIMASMRGIAIKGDEPLANMPS
jgi:hypothetical protein